MSELAARIIGIGQTMAGDDAVGLAVVEHLARTLDAADVEVIAVTEPSRMVPLLTDGANPVILVDAVLDGGRPGRVVVLKANRRSKARLLSTHGVGVRDAIALARATDPDRVASHIAIVGVTIANQNRRGAELSREIQAAITAAANRALRLAHE